MGLNKSEEVQTKVENLPLDLNINELQAQGGYINAFLNEHQMIMAAMTNPAISGENSMLIVAMAIRLKVSLITDEKLRGELWKWYEDELANKLNGDNDASQRVRVEYGVAIVLLGKIMSFVGKHLSKPVEIGTE